MACLVKAPQGVGKGIASFTTQERNTLIRRFEDISDGIRRMKSRYLIGLHHNWHDTNFRHDPLFDFNLAGEDDLTASGAEVFPLIPMDACNFSPSTFTPGGHKFWDVLFVARAVEFKGIPQFFYAIRALFDQGDLLRVLFLCPLPPAGPGTEIGLRTLYENLFAPDERKYFTFLTMEWDYPFPLDVPTLAYFYRSSRIFVHSAPDERRCRVAAYAWASAMPVVGMACVGSILPSALRMSPYFFECENYTDFPRAIRAALMAEATRPDFSPVLRRVSLGEATREMEHALSAIARSRGDILSPIPINAVGFDIRLGQHHGLATGANRIEQDLGAFVNLMVDLSDEEIAKFALGENPEIAIATCFPANPRPAGKLEHSDGPFMFFRRIAKVFA